MANVEPEESGAMAADNVTLELRAEIRENALHVGYGITNRDSRSLVSFDGAIGVGGGEFPDLIGNCYVSSTGPGVVRILRIRPPAHPTKNTTYTFMPPAAEVKPGETRRVRLGLALPLKERSEFSPDFPGATYEKQTVARLELRIGYFWKTEDTVLQVLTPPNVWRVVKGAPLSQIFQVAAAVPANCELLVRTDAKFIRM
jgi:hypothetical protein